MNKLLKYSMWVYLMFLWNVLFAQPVIPQFRAAVVKVNITPENPQRLAGYGERTSTGILDQIYHRIIAFDDGNNQFILASTEICSFSPVQYNRLAAMVAEKTGIRPANFWWSVTHTHSAPHIGESSLGAVFMPERHKKEVDKEYCSLVEQKLLDGIYQALNNLEPASLSVGWGLSQANINRRAIDADGKSTIGLNPDGATDRRIGLIRINKPDGSPLALIANYAVHGTVLGPDNLLISGDAPGVVSEYVEDRIGAPMVFINGAAGNLAPIYSVYPDPESGHLSQFRVLLGDKIIDAYNKMPPASSDVTFKTESITVETPLNARLKWPENLNQYLRKTSAGLELVRFPVNILKINEDIAIWSAPIELFCEISNNIRNHSPFPYTFYFGYTNGQLGYLPTEKEWKREGYEPSVSVVTPSAEKDITETLINYLQGTSRYSVYE